MYLITNNKGKYLKRTLDNIAFVANETLAEKFNSPREANDYISKHFPKKKKRFYKVSYVSDIGNDILHSTSSTLDKQQTSESVLPNGQDISFLETVQKAIGTYLSPDIDKYRTELKQYDDIILDIRHYIRDENFTANACVGYKIFKRLQETERKRVKCKKEFQRLVKLQSSIQKAITESENFEYEPYKNRIVENMPEFIDKGEINT